MRQYFFTHNWLSSSTSRSTHLARVFALVLLLASVSSPAPAVYAATLPTGFQETVVISGLNHPTAFRFAPDGRVFVAEKSGLIKEFDNLNDTSATIVADLRTNVHNFWDRGLLGLALDPNLSSNPYLYVLYTYDYHPSNGRPVPNWGSVGGTDDGCPNPPGATGDGCVVSGRLSRLQLSGNVMTGSEQVLIEDWCQQYPSHSIGSLEFGADGALYVSGGDGASFTFIDYGQDGNPVNPCGDPGGTAPTPPTAEGGALRSQDLRTSGDPASLNGAILRVNPATGDALPNNPLAGNSDANARRVIAYGLRNPFRITIRPDTNEVWVGDVGMTDWEEINRITNPTDSVVENFGWPCYEGQNRQSGYDGANLNICENLYNQANADTKPYFAYHHNNQVVPNEGCPTGSSSISGLEFEFYGGGSYPSEYDDALFFADYSRDCIWAMLKGADGHPNIGNIRTFVAQAANPVYVENGPEGDLFYADFDGGTIRRISYVGSNVPTSCPVGQYLAQYYNNMALTGTPTVTRCEASINYNWGTGSPDPGIGNENFSARWTGRHNFNAGNYVFTIRADDGMRLFLDGTLIIDAWKDQAATQYQVTRTLTAGEHEVKVEHYEKDGDAVAQVSWAASSGNTAPTATITSPVAGTTWKVGDTISFAGSATDAQDGTLPAAKLKWDVILYHCPSNCHTHALQSFDGVASGSFPVPDHEYPSYLELKLTATDSNGSTDVKTVRLDPKTVTLTFQSNPTGLQLTVGSSSGTAPFNRTVIVGSTNSIIAPSPQSKGKKSYTFQSWSDGGALTHNIVAPANATTYTARYR